MKVPAGRLPLATSTFLAGASWTWACWTGALWPIILLATKAVPPANSRAATIRITLLTFMVSTSHEQHRGYHDPAEGDRCAVWKVPDGLGALRMGFGTRIGGAPGTGRTRNRAGRHGAGASHKQAAQEDVGRRHGAGQEAAARGRGARRDDPPMDHHAERKDAARQGRGEGVLGQQMAAGPQR